MGGRSRGSEPLQGGQPNTTSGTEPERGRSATGRMLDGFVLAFAAFTLLANAAVIVGASLDQLGLATAACAVIAGAVAGWRIRTARPKAASQDTPATDETPTPRTDATESTTAEPLVLGGVAAFALIGVSSPWWMDGVVVFWGCALCASSLVLVRSFQLSAATPGAPTGSPASTKPIEARWLLVTLCVASAIVVAVSHRSDHDDAFYINLSVAAADAPGETLMAFDTLHGLDQIPMGLPVLKVSSVELGVALVSRLLGVDTLTLAQVWLPPLLAALIALAYACLLRELAPRQWPWLLAGVFAYLALFADGSAPHGDFAFLRMQQGKSAMLHIMLPLVAANGLAFARRPGLRRFALLAAAQIGAVGFSVNALWIAPMVGGLAVLAGLRLDRPGDLQRGMGILAAAFAASFHPLLLALWLRAETLRAFAQAPNQLPSLAFAPTRLMSGAVETVTGTDAHAGFVLFAAIAALALAPNALFRRFLAVNLLAFVVLLWNPLFADVIGRQITGPDTYFRVLWVLPVPIMVAVLMCGALPFVIRWRPNQPGLVLAAFVIGVGASFALASDTPTLSTANGVRFGWPDVKVEPGQMTLARTVARHAGPEDFVLVDTTTSRWLPLLNDHPHPLVVREMLLDVLHDRLGRPELTRRVQLTRMVGGEVHLPHGGDLLARAIDDYPLSLVALSGRARDWADLQAALEASPLALEVETPAFEIWARPQPLSDEQ